MLDRVIGHRGAAAYAPENTIESFKAAFDAGCLYVEFDVVLSLDKEAFIFHDDNLARTSNGRGEISEKISNYISSLDAGSWFSNKFSGAKIPTLRETLIWLATNNMQANIEIKSYHDFTEQTARSVISHIDRYWPPNKTLPLVSSFHFGSLMYCHDRRPDIPLGLLLNEWPDNWLRLALRINCKYINLSRRIVTEARVKDIKKHGYKVCVFTINRKSTAQRLFQWGVDRVFSDYPDLMK